jgi:hypothetical protein
MSEGESMSVSKEASEEESAPKFLRHLMLTLEVETDDYTRCDGCPFREVDVWSTSTGGEANPGERMLWKCAAPAPWGGSDVTEVRPEECMDAEAPF